MSGFFIGVSMADLRLGVDTSQVDKGKQSLDALTDSAKKAADASDALYQSQNKAMNVQKSWSDGTNKEAKAVDDLLNSINPLNKAFEALEQKQLALNKAFSEQRINSQVFAGYNEMLDTQRDKLQRAQDALTSEGRAAQAEAAEKERATKTAQAFIQSLERQTAAIGKSKTELLTLRAAQLGVSDKAAPMIKALEDTAKAAEHAGINSSAARREIGILIGELARGNFGQLRSSGITLANRAGWIDQLLSLKGLGIAAVIGAIAGSIYALSKAWYEGSQEAIEFNKNIILTGNYVGKTSGQLVEMAESIAHASGVTTTAAAETINGLVLSGKVSGDALQKVAQAIQNENIATGKSVKDLTQEYTGLARDPQNAVMTLNNQYHFLTASTYEQIAALQRQGDTQAAAELAMNSYADAMDSRSKEIIENMGYLQKAWIAIGTAAAEAWNKMLNIGKGDTLEERLAAAQKAASQKVVQGTGIPGQEGYITSSAQREASQGEVNYLTKAVTLSQDLAQIKSDIGEQNEKDIKSLNVLDRLLVRRMDNDKKRAFALKTINELQKRGVINAEQAAEYTDAANNLDKAGQRTPKTKAVKSSLTQGDNRLTQAQAQLAVLQEQTNTLSIQNGQVVSLTDGQKKIIELDKLINSYKGQTLNAQQKSVLANAEELRSVYRQIDAQEVLLRQRKQQLELQLSLQNDAKSIDRNISVMQNTAGMSTVNANAYRDQLGLQDKFSTAYGPDWQKNTEALKEYQAALSKLNQQQEATAASQQNLLAGISTGYQDWATQATNLTEIGNQSINTLLNGTVSAFANALNGSGSAFKDFAVNIIQMIEKIILQLLVAQAIQAALGWLVGGATSGAASGTSAGASSGVGAMGMSTSFSAYDDGGYTGDGGKYDPAGVVHKGEFVFTKEATKRIGVDNLYAQMKGYASGGYVGQAPASGSGSSSGAMMNITVPVTVQGDSGNSNSSNSAAIADAYDRTIKKYVKQGINEELKPGGMIYKANRGK